MAGITRKDIIAEMVAQKENATDAESLCRIVYGKLGFENESAYMDLWVIANDFLDGKINDEITTAKVLVLIALDPRSKAHKKTCERCDSEYFTDLPYSAICPKCRKPSGPKGSQVFFGEQRNGRSRLFK